MIKHAFLLLLLAGFGPRTVHAQKSNTPTPALQTTAQSGKLVWQEWNKGYELAKQTGKIILVDAYTDWCSWCKRMDRDTYSHPGVIELINKDFVAIKFNPEIEDKLYIVETDTVTGPQLLAMLAQGKSTGFPTTFYLFPRKMRLIIDPGYKKPDEFMRILQSAIEENKK